MKKVLIVEDTRVINNIVSNEFKKLGYDTFQAYDYATADLLLKSNYYDLIILDLHLPDGEGQVLVKKVQSLTNTKVVVLTASNKDELREELFSYGIYDYIIKDKNLVFSINELNRAIKQINDVSKLNMKKKILVVEDSFLMLNKIEKLLSTRGYDVDTASNAKETFENIKKRQYDLITLDLELPDAHGIKVLEIIKQKHHYIDVPIFIISGATDINIIREVYKKGGSDFIRKPFISEEFILKVDFWIGYRQNHKDVLEQKDLLLSQQSKMATMGEMLENIIHQSKQPLSVINAIASANILDIELEVMNEKNLLKDFTNITNQVSYISNTMTMFRNFFKPKSVKEKIDIRSLVEKAINLINSKINNYEIQIINQIGDEEIKCYEIEILQVLLNFFSNSRDAFDEKEIEEKYIFIKSYYDDDMVVIEFLDNAGGIKKDLIDKIFQSHFSTKSYKGGSGIGLSMSQDIIKKHHEGVLEVEIVEYEYNQKQHTGAKFSIKIPRYTTKTLD